MIGKSSLHVRGIPFMVFRFGTYSTSDSVNAGMDLEMPGPSRQRGSLLQGALASNKVTQHTIDERARTVLNLVNKCAASGIPENAEEKGSDTPETAALLKEISADSIVLLKNEGSILPLKKNKSVSSLFQHLWRKTTNHLS